jgi:hypothetical protein
MPPRGRCQSRSAAEHAFPGARSLPSHRLVDPDVIGDPDAFARALDDSSTELVEAGRGDAQPRLDVRG